MNSEGFLRQKKPAVFAILDSPLVIRTMFLVGRLAIAYLFLSAATFHLSFGWSQTIADMTARGVPVPALLNVLAMTISSALVLALLFNYRARWASLGLALYTVCVSAVMYTPGPGVSQGQYILFMKDMAIFGGLMCFSCALAMADAGAGKRRP